MNTETTTLPGLHSYTTMPIEDLWAERKRLCSKLANGLIDQAAYDQHNKVIGLTLLIRADEWELSGLQQRLAESRQRLVALVPPELSREALFALCYIAEEEGKGDPAYLIGFASKQKQTINEQLLVPGLIEIVDAPEDPGMDVFGKFYIVTPAGLALFKDK